MTTCKSKDCNGCPECSVSSFHAERVDALKLARLFLIETEFKKGSASEDAEAYTFDGPDILLYARFIQGVDG